MRPKEVDRFEEYRDEGVRDWVRNTLRGMTDNWAVAKLKGIGTRDTYTPEDGSGELNMGRDIYDWKRVARKETASAGRKQKREWLTTIGEVLDRELKAAIADENADDAFKARCRALLKKIPTPLWMAADEDRIGAHVGGLEQFLDGAVLGRKRKKN